MAMWSPWRGCHRCSQGCKYCYIHKGDIKRSVNTDIITKSEKDVPPPLAKTKKGEYKIKSGQTVYVCFSSDFLIEEADEWRAECWEVMKLRDDVNFIFLTKRIERFMDCIPDNWNDGYDNVTVGCTIENQEMADYRLNIFDKLPIKHKNIICQPMIDSIDLNGHLDDVELVVVGGESDKDARPLNYDWVLSIREQCVENMVNFEFRQCGTHFVKENKEYTLNVRDLCAQARKADINYYNKKE